MRQGLPIKCVEAVFLALLLTAGWNDLDRIPVGFKTCVAGHVYRCCPDDYQQTVVGASGHPMRPRLCHSHIFLAICDLPVTSNNITSKQLVCSDSAFNRLCFLARIAKRITARCFVVLLMSVHATPAGDNALVKFQAKMQFACVIAAS